MSDPTNQLCGITIDIIPRYSNSKTRKKCRKLFWEDDEINGKFKKTLESAGIRYLTILINSRFVPPSYLRVCTEAWGDEDTDEGTRIENFYLEIDCYGDAEMEEIVTNIVIDDSIHQALCKNLRTLLTQYIFETLPDVKLTWKIEIGECRQP